MAAVDRLGDRRDVAGALALAENHLRKTLPQRPVMVDLGEAQVFEGHVAQPRQRFSDRHRSAPHTFKKFFQPLRVHGKCKS
jgi:hypothetical protein